MDQLSALRAFVRVVERGSLSAAARALGVTPAMVTRHIGQLERHLGARLFNRTTRQLHLTEAGQRYFDSVQEVLRQLDAVESDIGLLAAEPSGLIRLSCGLEIGETLLPPLLMAFQARYPGIALEVDLSNRFVDILREGFDLVLRFRHDALPDNQVASLLGCARFVFCASPAYLQRCGPLGHPAELERHPCLIYTGYGDEWPFSVAGEPLRVKVRGRLRSNSNRLLVQAAMAGEGITMQPRFGVQAELASGALVPVLEAFLPPDLRLYAALPHGRHIPGRVRALLAFIREYTGEGECGGVFWGRARPPG